MIYCSKCTYPIIAVNLAMSDENVCSGCIIHEEKLKIDWSKRVEKFKELLLSYKSNNSNYDCIIPVSGGKDSHFQAYYTKKLGLNPLLVTYYTHNYTKTSEENLKNIGNIVKTMVKEKFEWKKKLLHLRNKKIYNLSKSGKIGSEFISNYLKSNRFN